MGSVTCQRMPVAQEGAQDTVHPHVVGTGRAASSLSLRRSRGACDAERALGVQRADVTVAGTGLGGHTARTVPSRVRQARCRE